MILLTWNLHSRTNTIRQQLRAISKYKADVLAFQEVTKYSLEKLVKYLQELGYENILDSFSLSKEKKKLKGKRKYGQIIASKYKLKERSPEKFDVPWRERILSADILTDKGMIEIHNVHIPPGASNGWIKIDMFDGIYKHLALKTNKLRILCGDFNSPQSERKGKIITWGQKEDGRITNESDRKWDKGERNVLEGLKNFDLEDVYRMDKKNKRGFSFKVRQTGKRRRFDHIFASKSLKPVECRYLHEVRWKGLSDHSAMMVVFDI